MTPDWLVALPHWSAPPRLKLLAWHSVAPMLAVPMLAVPEQFVRAPLASWELAGHAFAEGPFGPRPE